MTDNLSFVRAFMLYLVVVVVSYAAIKSVDILTYNLLHPFLK